MKFRNLFKKNPFKHLEIYEFPEDFTEKQIKEEFSKKGIELVPREATMEDLMEGLSESEKKAFMKGMKNERM